MESLMQAISEIRFESETDQPTPEDHRKIRTLLREGLDSGQVAFKKRPPPFEVLRYAAYNIVFPSFLIQQTPDFLDLLSMIDAHRQHNTTRAEKILEIDAVDGESNPGTFTSLHPDEIVALQKMVNEAELMRQIYMKILSECCINDLYHIWLSESNTEFWIRWNEYFPFLSEAASPRTFHHGLSEQEVGDLRHSAGECSELLHATLVWAKEQISEGQYLRDIFRTVEFQQQYPPPRDFDSLSVLIRSYVELVNDTSKQVDEILETKEITLV